MSSHARSIFLAVIALGAVAACATDDNTSAPSPEPTQQIAVDGPTFASVTELAAESELYIVGTVGEVISREQDSGGASVDIEEQASVPVKFVGIEVEQSSNESAAPVGSTVPVVWLDFGEDVEVAGNSSDLQTGSTVVLFAKTMTRDSAPGIETVDSFLSPIGGQNGVFDVQDDVATARDAMLVALESDSANPDSDSGDEPLSAPVADVTRVAEKSFKV